jgi:hypothetical protein
MTAIIVIVKLPALKGGASRKGKYLFQIASLNPALKGAPGYGVPLYVVEYTDQAPTSSLTVTAILKRAVNTKKPVAQTPREIIISGPVGLYSII